MKRSDILEAKFIKIEQDYENDVFSVETGKKKSDYLGQVGLVVGNKKTRLYGVYELEFDDGQHWAFLPSQLEIRQYRKRERK